MYYSQAPEKYLEVCVCVCVYKLAKSDVIIFYMTLIVAMVCSYSSGFIEWEALIHQ